MSVSRRQFAKLGALGFAAQVMPGMSAVAQESGKKVGYCVIGLGRIADHFMRGVQHGSTSKITGLVSGHRDKALRIAAQYGVPESSIYSYEDMDRIRENKAIDAVYVALPNNMHAEYTIRSAKAGKHVLCEKPMATSVSDAEAMIDACKTANVKLMIAYRCQYEPTNLKAVKLIREGAIGKVQVIHSAFGGNFAAGEWRLTKKYGGGGSLMDVGIYALNATRYLTGEEPVAFSAFTSTLDQDGRFNEVDENLVWTTRFPSGVLANCSSTYGANMPGYYRVYGSKGWVEVGPAFSYDGMRLRAQYSSGIKGVPDVQLDEENPDKDPMHFTREADHFSECIVKERTPKTPGEEGLRDMRYMKEIYRTAGVTVL